MSQYEHLPIYKKIFDLVLYTEGVVKGFSRYQKYTLGSELRNLTRKALMLTIKANNEVDKRILLLELRMVLEEIKLSVRLSKEVKAFKSFSSFEYMAKALYEISIQNEGWLKSQNQNSLK